METKTKKLTAWEHIKVAHDHLLTAYSMIDVTQFYADTLNRALRNAALVMGQMPIQLSKRNRYYGKKKKAN